MSSTSMARRYLLGQLAEDEAEEYEAQLLADESAREQLTAAEEELIEAYAARTLAAEHLQAFDSHFSDSDRMKDVQIARLLMRKAATQVERGASERTTQTYDILRRRGATSGRTTRSWVMPGGWNLALAAGVLIATGVASAWLMSTVMRSRASIAQQQLAQRLTDAESRIAGLTRDAGPTFELTPATRGPGGGAADVQIPDDTAVVRLGFRVPTDTPYAAYRIQLRREVDPQAAVVWVADVAAPDVRDRLAVVRVPTAMLTDGYYIGELRGLDVQSASTLLAEIPFLVRR